MAKRRKTDDDFQKTAKRNQATASRYAGIRVVRVGDRRNYEGYPVYYSTAPERTSRSVGPQPQPNIKVLRGGSGGEGINRSHPERETRLRLSWEMTQKIAREGGKAKQRFLASEKNKSGRNTAKNAKRRER